MAIELNDGGTWKGGKPFVKSNGEWVEVNKAYVKDNGVWKTIYTDIGPATTIMIDDFNGSSGWVENRTPSPDYYSSGWDTPSGETGNYTDGGTNGAAYNTLQSRHTYNTYNISNTLDMYNIDTYFHWGGANEYKYYRILVRYFDTDNFIAIEPHYQSGRLLIRNRTSSGWNDLTSTPNNTINWGSSTIYHVGAEYDNGVVSAIFDGTKLLDYDVGTHSGSFDVGIYLVCSANFTESPHVDSFSVSGWNL